MKAYACARIFFCALPALAAGVLVGVWMHPLAGVFACAVMFGHGWQVTTPRRERGERE